MEMDGESERQIRHPFPPIRPNVEIVESGDAIDEIDCAELRWWFAIPRPGDHTMWATYDAKTLELSFVTDMVATAPARVCQIECVEIRVEDRKFERDLGVPNADMTFYARTEETDDSRWIAVFSQYQGKKEFLTLHDGEFDPDWGTRHTRKLYDDGRYKVRADGSYEITGGTGLGAGVYDVTVGERTFHCLRVLEVDVSEPEGGELTEAYVEQGGRTVFHRRYDGRFYRGVDLAQKYPDNLRITIGDREYVHCDCTGRAHDVNTGVSLGWHGTK